MIRIAAGMLFIAVAQPALAQDPASCQKAIVAHRQAAIAVTQKAADPAAALQARAELTDEEASARIACERIPQFSSNIDVTKEDLDLALGSKVPACRAAIEAAAPHVKAGFEIAPTRDAAMGSKALVFLLKARKDAEEPCKDYPGVLGRILRAENALIFSGATSPN